MTKSIKNILIISTLFLLMLGVTGTASATTPHNYDNATAFLDNITNLQNNSVVQINCSQANVSQNYTISASNITIQAINGQVTFQSNTSNIHFIINGNNVTLQGIKFQNFNGTSYAGAIRWNGDNGTLINCNFNNNTAYKGGAIYVDTVTNWNMNNCTFHENTAYKGGAINVGTATNWNMNNCTFHENNAMNGGAINVGTATNWNMVQCNFTENNADQYAGAIYTHNAESWNMTDCIFDNNEAAAIGGAIYTHNAESWNMNNCTFTENTAIFGGVIYAERVSNWNMNNCTFTKNIAINRGAICNIESLVLNMNNCTFSDNNDTYGADICNVYNMTLTGNSKAIIYNEGTITNTLTAIILGNKTVGVAENEDFNLTAFIKVGNYTIIGPQEFNFTINNNNLTATLTGDHYTSTYHVTGAVGDIIPVNGSYAYTNSTVNYQTGNLLIKNSVVITGNNATYPYNKKIEVKLNATTSNGTPVDNGTVSITINGKTYTGEVSNGKATIETTDKIDAGVYYLTAVYEENYDYLNATFDFTLTITQTNSMVGITVDDVNYGETAIVKIATIPEMTGNLTLVINGKPRSVSTNTKQYNIAEQLNAGTYSVYAYYVGDNNFKFSDNLTSFTVKPIATHTNVTVDNSTVDKVVLYINASDIYNNPVNGTAIATIKNYGTYYSVISNGVGMIVISNLPTGEYFADIVFTPSSNYNESTANCTFETSSTPTPVPAGYNLTASNVYKEFENATQYHAILTDINGNPIANKTIAIAISSAKWSKDALYWITTNKDGIATLTINLLPNEYVITALYGDEIAINNITIIPSNLKLQASALVKYFMNGTQYTVKVTDVNNNPVANRTVTITINKATWKSPVKYYAKTNADGIASLDINLIAGLYSVTANICYNSTKSSITVLPTLTASSITKKINKEANLKAKLVNGQGSPASNKEVTFTVKDKTYYLTTDANGVATLPIHLGLGTWSFLIANPETNAQTRATVKVIR